MMKREQKCHIYSHSEKSKQHKRLFAYCLLAFLLLNITLNAAAQDANAIRDLVAPYFTSYTNNEYTSDDKIRVDSVKIIPEEKWLGIYVNEGFVSQPFRPEMVKKIYAEVNNLLQEPYNKYKLTIFALEYPIEVLIPSNFTKQENRDWNKLDYNGNPWVTPMNNEYKIRNGLQGRHISAWASHGKYYAYKKSMWTWQRPHLYCTTEDLFTQTIVLPYLFPMLENAGAVVFSPRERDWQKNEVIVDNDLPYENGKYEEVNGKYEWKDGGQGWGRLHTFYQDKENPFEDGSYRMAVATGKRQPSSITWTPNIPVEGDYAVYVSYKTLTNSISDAMYTVRHQGINTRFRVNQQMGGGTWVYLGTFHFGAGATEDNCIFLSNQSEDNGIVTADAVRLGGGMGNVMRSDTLKTMMSGSGVPRYLEASRYYAQWAGAPYEVYSPFESKDDYSDDIRGRSLFTNYVGRGSIYMPGDSGLNVPIEMSIALHSDAGFRPDMTHIGTLGIYMSRFNEGLTDAGISRLASRDMADNVMSQVTQDIRYYFGNWNRRQLYDRNYGEARDPGIPAMILEMLSHQNFFDMIRGHDPYFKFILARAIYKGLLKYSGVMHGYKPVTQPLPVKEMCVHVEEDGIATLTWTPVIDPTDDTASPEGYMVYARVGHLGYDNGTLVKSGSSYELQLQPNLLYRFRVAAINNGGRSFLSEEVCARFSPGAPRLLVVNGFQRVAGPQVINNEQQSGFDFSIDPGVADVRTAGYCGYQYNFSKSRLGYDLGQSGDELLGMILMGNTHDYTTQHAQDFLTGGNYTIGSCEADALGVIPTASYQMMDVIMGAQRVDGYSGRIYKTFTPELQQQLQTYLSQGGRLMVSGAYIGSDMQSSSEQAFTSKVLKYQFMGQESQESLSAINGMNTQVSLFRNPSEQHYWITRSDILQPTEGAFSTMTYQPDQQSAAIAYQGQDYRTMAFGFPLECIENTELRRSIMNAALQFLLTK